MALIYNTLKTDGKIEINTAITFVDAFNTSYSAHGTFPDFTIVFTACDALVRGENPNVDNNALSNARGAWYQWLFALAWQEYASLHNQNSIRVVKLPAKTSGKWHRLYDEDVTDLIDDLEAKIALSNITLETSNPDFVAIQEATPVIINFNPTITVNTLNSIDTEFISKMGTITYGTIPAFISIKTSLRPDRRLQTQFEATMIKALQAYIATRKWDPVTNSSKFIVVVNSAPSARDRQSLAAIAAHSLVTPLVVPQKLVDALEQVTDYPSAQTLFLAL